MPGFFIIALVSYLIGSIPSGYVAGRIAGIDIRKVGSGNIGATNVTRALGKVYGYAVFIADVGKGLSAVLLSKLIARQFSLSPDSYELCRIIAGVLCVMGNAFPIWLRFRGGKGVATSAGVFYALAPLAALIATVLWIVIFATTRYVSLASIVATVALPMSIFVMTMLNQMKEPLLFYVTSALAVVVVLRHRSNLSRLIRGTEQRFRRSGESGD